MVDQNDMNQLDRPMHAMAEVRPLIRADQARVNITWQGENADLPDPVSFDATDGDVKQWATEAVRAGFPGIRADAGANFGDFVVDRFRANDACPYNRIMLRPKTPFGADPIVVQMIGALHQAVMQGHGEDVLKALLLECADALRRS